MSEAQTDWVDGWEIHYRGDGGYAVYDEHGMIAGPFGTKRAAMQAALLLPKRTALSSKNLEPSHLGHR